MLRLIALFIIIYLAFRLITTWLFPRILKWYIERQKRKFYEANPQARQASKKKKSGDMDITYTETPKKGNTDKIGEYVDFKEITDNKKE